MESSLLSQPFPSRLFTQWLPCPGAPTTGILQCTDPTSQISPTPPEFYGSVSPRRTIPRPLWPLSTPDDQDPDHRWPQISPLLWLHLSYIHHNGFKKYLVSYQDMIIKSFSHALYILQMFPLFFASLKSSTFPSLSTVASNPTTRMN